MVTIVMLLIDYYLYLIDYSKYKQLNKNILIDISYPVILINTTPALAML